MKTIMIFLVVQNVAFKGAMMLILDCIRSLQMILHLPMLKNTIPGNLGMINSKLIDIVMFDVLPSDKSVDLIFTYNETQIEEVESQMYD